MDIDCCSGNTYTLSPGQQFDFVNYQSQQAQVTSCNPPLAGLSYTVPAAQGGTPGRCSAKVADQASPGTYTLGNTGCPSQHTPVIKVSG